MTNADKFKTVFGMYSEEFWAKPEQDMLNWINSEYQEPQTNAERIRSMTDEELGKLLNEFGHCPLSRIEDDCRSYDRCRDCWIDWLKEEVEE